MTDLSDGEKDAECDESGDGGDVVHPEDDIAGLEGLGIEDLSLQVFEGALQCSIHLVQEYNGRERKENVIKGKMMKQQHPEIPLLIKISSFPG